MALDSGQAVKIIMQNVRLRVPIIISAENQYTCIHIRWTAIITESSSSLLLLFSEQSVREIGENQLKLADNLGIEMPASIME